MEHTDSELVAQARTGDTRAFGQLIERYSQMVRRIALGMIAHEEIARGSWTVPSVFQKRSYQRSASHCQKGKQ